MLVLINALKSISRSKGRNILIGIIVLTIAISSSVALSIKNAASKAEIAGLDSINITASISVDRQKILESSQTNGDNQALDRDSMREVMSQYGDLNLTELQTYADSSYVKDFYYSSSINLNGSGELEPYSTESSNTETNTNQGPGGDNGFMGGQGPEMFGGITLGDFTITGANSENAMTNFISGSSQITDGEMFDINGEDMSCLISSELASFNGLSVGDKITLANPNSETETYELTISGIYTDTSSSDTGQMRFSTAQDPANLIYISQNALTKITDNSATVATTVTDANGNETTTKLTSLLTGTFVFANKADFDSFSTEVREKGLSEFYSVTSSDINSYEASLVPLKNLSNFATTLLIIIIGIGAVILIVINVFNIRERKYEVGVLTAIGIKKWKVALQFVTELMFITLAAIVLGSGIGAAVSVPVSNNLLQAQIESQESSANTQNQNFGRPGGQGGPEGGNMSIMGPGTTTDVAYVDQINATTNITILLQMIGIGIILTIISSAAAVVFVLRYEPLKILANRS